VFHYRERVPLLAPFDATVLSVTATKEESVTMLAFKVGPYVVIFDGIERTAFKRGQTVSRGQAIGVISGSGRLNNYAVEVMVKKGKTFWDPAPFFRAGCAQQGLLR
jgi:hypothetical protein